MSAEEPPASSSQADTVAATAAPGQRGASTAAADFPRRLEHYEILSREDGSLFELGRGAMGITYKALDTRLQCHVALKVINAQVLTEHPVARERFLREARAAARLRHANVASVFHLSDNAAGHCFYAMEFIEGENLTERVRRTGPLPAAFALEIALQVARALVAADQQKLIHRDLKPGNLMLTAGAEAAGRPSGGASGSSASASNEGATLVKVIDFGLAKAAVEEGDDLTLGGFVGTPQFASPEQLDTQNLDARSDIYSLGCTLWYMLTGKPPFPGRSLPEIQARQHEKQLPVEQLAAAGAPAPVSALFHSLLAFDPANRPQTPSELVEAIWRCRQELATAASPSSGFNAPAVQPANAPRQRTHGIRALAVAAAFLVVAAVGAAIYFLRQPPLASREKSLAVLPFENLSADPENAFFADGVQDDVLTSLSKISELKVISRSSVLPYRDPATRGNLREIGRQLGVANFLEGAVRRSANRVIISVTLVDAATSRQLWAEKYDRPLSDALTLQGEVASEIASALRTGLSPEERARVASKPTGNADAYVLYLRAREAQTRAAFRRPDYEAAEKLFEQAVAMDPDFALAHARLSQTRSQIAHFFEPTPALRASARLSAETSLRLQPSLGEAHLASALQLYWLDRDLPRAKEQFALAARALPNDPDIEAHLAAIQRREGNWNASREGFERAMAINPRNPDIPYELATIHAAQNNWPAAARMADRAVALAPDVPVLKLWRGDLLFHWKGDLAPLKTALSEMPSPADQEELPVNLRYSVAMIERNYAAAERILADSKIDVFTIFDYGAPRPRSFLQGLIYLARRGEGDASRARVAFEAARPSSEAAVQEAPNDAYRHAHLGLLYAALGWRDAALGEGWRAAELLPESQDAIDGPVVTTRRAQIYALLADADGALPILERLLSMPTTEMLCVPDLRLRPEWDPIRADPRFQKLLLAEREPAAVR